MREAVGSIWDLPGIRVIPTNGRYVLGQDMEPIAVMGAGLARGAKIRYPRLPKHLGRHLQSNGNHVACFYRNVVTFPTKEHWADHSTLALIERSTQELVVWWKNNHTMRKPGEDVVLMPRVGCGLGGLQWESVKPILEKYLDDKFLILTPPSTW